MISFFSNDFLFLCLLLLSSNSSLNHWCAMTQQWVATLRLHWKVDVYSNLTTCKDTVTAWRTAIMKDIESGQNEPPSGQWAIRTPSGQNVWRVGKTFQEVGKKKLFIFCLGHRLELKIVYLHTYLLMLPYRRTPSEEIMNSKHILHICFEENIV